jgi:hypothetical protein
MVKQPKKVEPIDMLLHRKRIVNLIKVLRSREQTPEMIERIQRKEAELEALMESVK